MSTENQNTPFIRTQRNFTGYATLAEADAELLFKYAGLTVYDISTDTFYYWTGSFWNALLTSGGAVSVSWGNITGLLSGQADLQAALNAKQNTITLGTTAQYFRGDLSLATFPTALSAFSNDPGFITSSALTPLQTQINSLLNNVFKVTYYEIISGTSGSITPPTGATINADEFGLSDDAILSKINGSNKPTFESPKTAGGVVVTTSLNTITGAYLASGAYVDSAVALIYSINISGADYANLNSSRIIESEELDGTKLYASPLIYTASTDTLSIQQSSSLLDGYLSSTDWNVFNGKEAAITSGTTLQYWRGDKTFQTLNTSVVPEGTNLYYTQARFDTAFAAKFTTDLTEGTNLYFTNERVDDRVAALILNGTGINWIYNDVLNTLTANVTLAPFTTTDLTEGTNLYYTNARFDTRFATKTTTDLAEGTNLYYTVARFNTAFATKSTTDLTEGTNLYYTDERVDDRVAVLIQNGTGISWSYSDAGNTLTPTITLAPFSTTNLAEGTNLYFTTARARLALSNTAPITYNNLTGAIGITQSGVATDGYLSTTDWNTFNNKQPAGNYITALTGDATASGPGSVALTLASIITASTKGAADKSLTLTYDAKGRLTVVTENSIQITESQVTGLPADINLMYDEASTGLISFGGLAINADTTKFNVGAVSGYFIDSHTNPLAPTKTFVTFAAQNAITVTNLATQNVTYVGIDATGTIIQSSSPFIPAQHRTIIRLGVIVHSSRVIVNAINNQPNSILNSHSQLNDVIEGLGVWNITGNVISANGANLNINKSAGELFKAGSNFVNDNKDPHTVTTGAMTASSAMRYRLQNGTESANTALIDPNNYDLANVLTAVPDTKYTVQYIYLFQSNLIRIQYGQGYYDSMDDARAAIRNPAFVIEQNLSENGLMLCALVVKKGCTDLSNTEQAIFTPIERFGRPSETNTGTGLFRKQILNDSSTGLISGGTLSIASGTQINIAAGKGLIVDNTTDPSNPRLTEVSWNAFSNTTITTLANPGTAIFINSAGAVVQMNLTILPSGTDARDKIFLGGVGHPTGVVSSVFNVPNNIASPISQLNDFTAAIGPFTISGNKITKTTGNLTLNKASGKSFFQSGNFQTDKSNPSILTTSALVAPSLSYVTQTTFLGFVSTSISTSQYDNAGVLTNIPNNDYVAHRIWHQPSNNILFFQYAQVTYSSFANAQSGFPNETYVVPPPLEFGAYLIAVIITRQGEANLDNASRSLVIPQGKFAGTGSGVGNADTFQTAYTNSAVTELLTDSTRGAVTFQRGSAADTDNVFEIKNGAGTTTMAVTGNGSLFLGNHTGAPVTPVAGGKIYIDSSNRLSWIGTNGFTRTLDGTANTASRIYTLQDKAGTIAHLDDITGTGSYFEPVISQLNAPPAHVSGERYLINTSPTGAWVGFANNIAESNGVSWTFTAPVTNNTVFLTSTSQTFKYNGTIWVLGQGTPILQNGNILAAILKIGTNDAFNVEFKTNGTTRWTINTSGAFVRTNGTATTTLVEGFLTMLDTSTTALPGFQITQTVTLNRFANLLRYGQVGAGNFTGTTISSADTLQLSNGGTGANPYPVLLRGSIIYNLTGHTTTFVGSRQDTVGMRIAALNTLQTTNVNPFTVVGMSAMGVNNTATAFVDAGASTTSIASMRLRAGTAPTTPNNGDLWNDGTYIVSQQALSSKGYVGTGNRLLQADASGNMTAATEIIDGFLTAGTNATNLATASNWTGAAYTGTAITGTFQGQMYSDSIYYYVATADNVWIRIERALSNNCGYRATTIATSFNSNDGTIDCTSGTFTVTLPTAVGNSGIIYTLKNSGGGLITLATTSSQTIDGVTTKGITAGSWIRVQSNNANWIAIG